MHWLPFLVSCFLWYLSRDSAGLYFLFLPLSMILFFVAMFKGVMKEADKKSINETAKAAIDLFR